MFIHNLKKIALFKLFLIMLIMEYLLKKHFSLCNIYFHIVNSTTFLLKYHIFKYMLAIFFLIIFLFTKSFHLLKILYFIYLIIA